MGVQARAVALLLSFFSAFSAMAAGLEPGDDLGSILVLVNRSRPIPHTYVPEALVMPGVLAASGKEEYIYLRPEAAEALERLFEAARNSGHTLYAVSGYRSYAMQKGLFQRKVDEVGERVAMRTVAPPGASEHQLGLAMDINGETTLKAGLVAAFGGTPEGQWVHQNAHRFGFIIRYQEDTIDITGYAYEPWHLRYIGERAASEVYSLGITFEEYHMLLQQRRIDAWANDTEEP